MLDSFKNPPTEYRIAPFWFWNAILDIDEIERQVREMHSKGAGGFFIHGRFGLRTEYMGEQWMICIERACDTARELEMHVYLYDENPFPSGVAGGEAMKNEQHFNKYLDIARHAARPHERVDVALPEGELLSAVAVDLDSSERIVDVTKAAQDGRLTWTAGDSRFEVLIFTAAVARYAGFIYGSEPDYFEESLLDTFFAHTHQRYAERLKPYFGSVIKGIFTDEPKIQCIHHMHHDASTTAWFADIIEQFRADHGYDLKSNLACLATDAGPQTGRARRDFWTTVTNQYVERFFKRYREWCEQNGIALTGHLFLEEGLYANTMYQGNLPQVLSNFDIPGVDHLALVAESDYGIGPNVPKSITRTHGQKLGSSTAHAHGKTRVLSETFGCCGWTLSMEHMKWIVDWQMSMGVNFLCPHAFYYSLAGVRKTDAPPSQFYQATYWPHYKLFADYVARLSYALSQGRHKAQAALLYPIKGFQSEWAPGAAGALDAMIAEYFDTYCAYLLKEHVDYDILGEESIRQALSVDQQLRLAGEEYDLLILPPTTAIGCETAVKISEFAEDGGAIIATMLLPVEDADGDRHEEVRGIFSRLFGRDPLQLRENAHRGVLPLRAELSQGAGSAFFFEAPRPDDLTPVLRDIIPKAIRPEVSVKWNAAECYDVTYLHRVLDDGDLFFFANNAGQPREVQLSIRCEGAPYVLDPETGESAALANCTQMGSRTILLHRFEPHGSLLVYFGTEPALAIGRQVMDTEGIEVPVSSEWEFRTEQPNCLTLSEWNLYIHTQQDRMQYEYTTRFEAADVPGDLTLVLDDIPEVGADAGCAGSNCTVYINGANAADRRGWVLDVNFQSIFIVPLVQKGANEIRIVIEHGGWSGDPQLMVAECRLMGSFSLDDTRTKLLPPREVISDGSWTDQGYPFYSGTGVYRQTIHLPDFLRGQSVVIRAERPADMVEFVINGASAGVRPWPPFELDVTHLVKPGPNVVELKVTNSLANVLTSEPRASGLTGGVEVTIL